MTMKQRLDRWLPAAILTLIILQPIMDVISYWLGEWGMPGAITLLLRLGVLGCTALLGFVLSDRKWIYWLAAGICAGFFSLHAFACYRMGYLDLVGDFTNYVRIVQMPVTTLCLITFLRRSGEAGFWALQKGITMALLLTLLVEAVSVVTDTDPNTYSDGLGVIGWFNNTNSQSNNLSVLLPISLAWQLTWKRKCWPLFWATAIGGLLALYLMCPRLAYLGIVVVSAGICITILIIQRKQWKVALALGLLCALFIGLIPVSPMSEHLKVYGSYQNTRQSWVNNELSDDLARVQELQEKMRSGQKLTEEEDAWMIETLTPIYQHYIRDFVDFFGAERTIRMYNFTIDIHDFSALRPKKLMFAAILMDGAPVTSRLFGLELARFTVEDQIYDVENDFHGIYYLCGMTGLILYLAFMAYFVGLIVWALIKNAKRYFTMEAAGYGIALLMCLAHVYNTAGVLRRPNASIYLSVILAAVYFLVRVRKEKLPENP